MSGGRSVNDGIGDVVTDDEEAIGMAVEHEGLDVGKNRFVAEIIHRRTVRTS